MTKINSKLNNTSLFDSVSASFSNFFSKLSLDYFVNNSRETIGEIFTDESPEPEVDPDPIPVDPWANEDATVIVKINGAGMIPPSNSFASADYVTFDGEDIKGISSLFNFTDGEHILKAKGENLDVSGIATNYVMSNATELVVLGNITNWYGGGVGQASKLEKITLRNCSVPNQMFPAGLPVINSIEIGSGVDVIGALAFDSVTSVENLSISSDVKEFGYNWCKKMTQIIPLHEGLKKVWFNGVTQATLDQETIILPSTIEVFCKSMTEGSNNISIAPNLKNLVILANEVPEFGLDIPANTTIYVKEELIESYRTLIENSHGTSSGLVVMGSASSVIIKPLSEWSE
jgi:hypothetical protein